MNAASNLVPALSINAAAVEENFEFQDRIPHLAAISADWSPQALHWLLDTAVVDYNLEGFWIRAIIEGRPWSETGP